MIDYKTKNYSGVIMRLLLENLNKMNEGKGKTIEL